MRRPSLSRLGVLAAVAATAIAVPLSSQALASGSSHGPTVTVLSTKPIFPFQLAAAQGGVLVADGGTSTVTRLFTHTVVANGPQPGEIAGVAVDPNTNVMAYTSTDYSNGATALTIKPHSAKPVVASLSTFEQTKNPDKNVFYGVRNPSQCVKDALGGMGAPVSYKGQVDSHPYSVTSLGHGSWAVADAGGNDILKVDAKGHVSVIAVLPAQPHTITKGEASALGLPGCVVGVTYRFEAVPTDVEVGPHGMLYVSTLPGGPEGPALGARGSVYVVNPATGASHRIATGFDGATNVAVSPGGTVYVAELFGGRISVIRHGTVHKLVSLPGALAVEWASRGLLYASTIAPTDDNGNPTGHGSVVRIRLG
jgi:hypothetical protein